MNDHPEPNNFIFNCPCYSGKKYCDCCEPYHKDKKTPENGLILMRSRYSAYALHLVGYIVKTTHPQNPLFSTDTSKWKQDILRFCQTTNFQNLEIISFSDGPTESFVTFIAHLKQDAEDASFLEKSRFEKVNGKWLFRFGKIFQSPHALKEPSIPNVTQE